MSRKRFRAQRVDRPAGLWRKAALLAVSLLFFAASAYAGKAPTTDKAVPVYPGAEVDREADETMSKSVDVFIDEETGVSSLRSSFQKVYAVAATPEEVFAYYKKKFSAVEGEENYGTENFAAPPTEASFSVSFYDFAVPDASEYYCEYDCGKEAIEKRIKEDKRYKKKLKGLLARHRKSLEPGKWVHEAVFSGWLEEPNGDGTHFRVYIKDASVEHGDELSHSSKTLIHIVRQTKKTEEDFYREVEKKAAGMRREKVKKLTASEPKPEDMGVASYPGARYEAEATNFMRKTMATDGVSYVTDDGVMKVAEFYKKQGMKLLSMDKKSAWLKRCEMEYNKFLKQTMSTGRCDLSITIQNPWQAKMGGKKNRSTLITFVKEIME